MVKKRRVRNQTKPKGRVSVDKNPTIKHGKENVTFDFSYKNWIKSVNNKDFINKLPNSDEFSQHITKCLYEVIPYIQENLKEIVVNGSPRYPHPHCHVAAEDKKDIIEKIINDIHNRPLLDQEDDFKIWQFGTTQGVRLFAIHNHIDNVIYPIFIDYHHLIHPDPHYNQPDFSNMEFCPVTKFK